MVTQSSLINRVTSVGQSSAINNQPAIKDEPRIETLRPLTVYLNLQLVDDDGSDDPPSSNKRVIKQGKSYNMVVYASDTRNPVVPQTELKTTSDIDILLECMIDGNIHPIITIENPFRTMTYEQVALKEDVFSYDENYVQFHLTVPGECPIGAVTFQLSFRKAHTKFPLQYRQATSLELKVDGPYHAGAIRFQEKCYINVNKQLPDCAAVLYVTEVNSNKLHIICGHVDNLLHVDAPNWIPTKLADFVEQAKGLQKSTKEIVEGIRKTLRDFSSQGPEELLTWLQELLGGSEDQQKQISLIIYDETAFEIPWEMLEVADEVYLGAKAAIVRWSKVQLFNIHKLLAVENVQYEGSVLAYLDDKELGKQQTYAERKTLEGVQVTSCKLMRELIDGISITDALKTVGLIYLGCHGREGIVLGSNRSTDSDQVTYIDLQNPIDHPDPRPIVFVNACDSARLKQSNGLRRVFLARFASGYIGTLGRVVSTYASKIAGCILESTLMEEQGVQIAEVLRQLRAEAVGMIAWKKEVGRAVGMPGIIALHERRELTEEEKNLYFLHTFMYVYYGNPLARLKLDRTNAMEGKGA